MRSPAWGDAACLAAGGLAFLAFSPWNHAAAAVGAMAVLFRAVLHARPGRAFRRGWLFGAGAFGGGLWWLVRSFEFRDVGFGAAVALTAALVALLALYPALFAWASAKFLGGRPEGRVRSGRARAAAALWWLPAAWLLTEWLRGELLSGATWLQFGYAALDTPLAALAPVAGSYGLGLALALAAACVALAGAAPWRPWSAAAAAVLALWAGGMAAIERDLHTAWTRPAGGTDAGAYAAAESAASAESGAGADEGAGAGAAAGAESGAGLESESGAEAGGTLRVLVVQGNAPQDEKWSEAGRRAALARYADATAAHPGADLVVWPETAIPFYASLVCTFLGEMEAAAARGGYVLLAGLLTVDPQAARPRNSIVRLAGPGGAGAEPGSVSGTGAGTGTEAESGAVRRDPARRSSAGSASLPPGRVFAPDRDLAPEDRLPCPPAAVYYHKRHLVPFGERMPFEPVLAPAARFLGLPADSFAAGPARQPPLLAGRGPHALAASICYEVVFGAASARALADAALLVNVSNDAWFGDTAGPHQHLQMARMRALEQGRWLVRATNTGVSALVAPDGTVAAAAPQFETAVLEGAVTLREGRTPYTRWRDYPALILAALMLLAGWRVRRRRRPPAARARPRAAPG